MQIAVFCSAVLHELHWHFDENALIWCANLAFHQPQNAFHVCKDQFHLICTNKSLSFDIQHHASLSTFTILISMPFLSSWVFCEAILSRTWQLKFLNTIYDFDYLGTNFCVSASVNCKKKTVVEQWGPLVPAGGRRAGRKARSNRFQGASEHDCMQTTQDTTKEL